MPSNARPRRVATKFAHVLRIGAASLLLAHGIAGLTSIAHAVEPAPISAVRPPSIIVDAAELEAALRTAARFSPHLAWLGEGDATDTPLTVLAEGKASAGRAALGVQFKRQAYGHTALAARLQADAAIAHVLAHLGG